MNFDNIDAKKLAADLNSGRKTFDTLSKEEKEFVEAARKVLEFMGKLNDE